MAVAAPVLQLAGVVAPLGVLDPRWIQVAGVVSRYRDRRNRLRAAEMGESWRIGVDPSETTTLVRTGVFGWVRNPIFTAMLVSGSASPW